MVEFSELLEINRDTFSKTAEARIEEALIRMMSIERKRWIELKEHWRRVTNPRIPMADIRELEKHLNARKKDMDKASTGTSVVAARETAISTGDFITYENGRIMPHKPHNIRVALARWGFTPVYDSFARKPYLRDDNTGEMTYLSDSVLNRIWVQIDDDFDFSPSKDRIIATIETMCYENSFHPILDMLNTFQWDGTPRLETWLIDYFGVKDSPFVRAVSRIFLVAAVRRLLEPGCLFQEALILGGKQGVGKSTGIKELAYGDKWFTDSFHIQESDQRIIEQTQGKWIIEIPEMKGGRRQDTEHVKAQFSRTKDTARLPFHRTVSEVPRSFVMVMTSNEERMLVDPTGNRRFWPVWCEKRVNLKGLIAVRDQLWAEALLEAQVGGDIRLPEELWKEAETIQKSYLRENPLQEKLHASLGDMEGIISTEDVWRLVGVPVERRLPMMTALGNAMKELGFERARRNHMGKARQWVYFKGDSEQAITVRRSFETGDFVADYAVHLLEDHDNDKEDASDETDSS